MALGSFIAGVATAALGAWIASKFHVYQEDLRDHRDAINRQILEPLRNLIQSQYGQPDVHVEWNKQQYNNDALAQEDPLVYGPLVRAADPGLTAYDGMECALLSDVQTHHYTDLLASWERFRDAWTAHLVERREWMEEIAQNLFKASGLPLFVGGAQEYILHLRLAYFLYCRALRLSAPTLRAASGSQGAELRDGSNISYAAGRPNQIQYLQDTINEMLRSERGRANKLTADLDQLLSDKKALEGQFSEALVRKILPKHGCSYVSFWSQVLKL